MAAIGRGVGEEAVHQRRAAMVVVSDAISPGGNRDGTENPMSFTTTGAIVGQSPYREQICRSPGRA